MPRQKVHEVPPPARDPNIIRVEIPKQRVPQALHELARQRKAGAMGKEGYNRGIHAMEARDIITDTGEMSLEEKHARILEMVEEFINWSQREHKKEFEGKAVAERVKILKRLINGELESLNNGPGAEALNDWIAELYKMGY